MFTFFSKYKSTQIVRTNAKKHIFSTEFILESKTSTVVKIIKWGIHFSVFISPVNPIY